MTERLLTTTRVLLLTDDTVLATGLTHALEASDDLILAHVCREAAALTQAIQDSAPQVVLIDFGMGISLPFVSELRKSFPACSLCLWARHLPDELAHQMMTIGVRGILRRTVSVEDALTCLRKLSRDEVWFEEKLMAGFFSNPVVRLTRRETQLIALLAQGLKNKEIAYRLSLSEGTVKVYLSRLFDKLSVNDRFELALYGLRHLGAGQLTVDVVVHESAHRAPQGTAFAGAFMR